MRVPPRPIETYVLLDGQLVLLTGPEALALLRFADLGAYLREHRGVDPHLDRAIGKLRLLSAVHRAGAGPGTVPAEPAEPAACSGGRLTTRQAADLAGVTPRAVTRAIAEGRLRAEWFAGRWLIDQADADAYRAQQER